MTPRRAATRLLLCAGLTLSAATLARPAPVDAAAVTEYGYVTSNLKLPTSASQARSFGRDLDGDGHKDNQLGEVFASLAQQGFDFQGVLDEAITNGRIVMLHSLKAPTLSTTKNASYQVIYGKPTETPPLFDFSDSFTVGPLRSTRLAATIKEHRVTTAAGPIPVRLDVGSGIFALGMLKAKVVTTCTKWTCTPGKLNGAITREEIDARLVPEMAELLTAMIAEDCPGPGPESCASGSTGKTAQQLFDTNADLVVTTQELLENDLIKSLLAPDLDLLKGDGSPGQNGKKESLSFGVGFTSVKAKFVRP